VIGQTISHYRIVEKIGEGGMGVVYKAEDLRLGRTVALKFLAAHLLQSEDARKRFVREARAAAALDHPNICTLYEIDEFEGGAFMAMAYLEGRMLEARIAEGPLPLPLAVDIAKQVAKGLQEAHAKGISHRDIKPSNICLLETGTKELVAKILDFGLARAAGQTLLTRHDATVGTIAYMSPEQTQGSGVDHRTDIWALGVVLYEMITGQRPFLGDYEKAVIYSITCEQPEPITSLRSGVPMQLEWIVDKALAKNPEQRYQSCVELIVDLDAVARTLEGPASRVAPTFATGPRSLTGIRRSVNVTGEGAATTRKQRVRETVLDLGSQGLLPDRILSRSLDVLSRAEGRDSAELQARDRLLEDLTEERMRVGEFIERWHELDSNEAMLKAETASGKKAKWRDQRSQAEFFGIPLFHKAWGKDPVTGKERVASGIFAMGNIAVGLVAIGRWMSVGAVAIAPISAGLWVVGIIGVGLTALAPLGLSLSQLPWWQAVAVVMAAGLLGGFLYTRGRPAQEPGRLDQLALFSFRTWRRPGVAVQGGRVVAVCGRYVVDLTDTHPAGDRIEIEADAFLGVVRILVPAHWRVHVEGTPILGHYAGPPSRSADGVLLSVRGAATLASVQIEG
jgi:serine/threonine protein kinase